jgi:hypothetical protein
LVLWDVASLCDKCVGVSTDADDRASDVKNETIATNARHGEHATLQILKQPIDSPESRTGYLFPIRKRIEFNTYYEHQNNTGKRPYQQLNQFRLVLNLHF